MRSIELFAGAGGLALGVEAAGFNNVALFELNRNACDTLRTNREAHGWDVVEGDVGDFDFREYRDSVELVTGGPPCQPFSMGGKHKAQNDRRDMFPQAARVVREIRPKAFIFENVKGLTRKSYFNYFTYIQHQFRFPNVTISSDEDWQDHFSRLQDIYTRDKYRGLQYKVVLQLLNAAEFGSDVGVPQRRERVFIVGVRSDLGVNFHFPKSTHSMEALMHDQYVSGDYWDRHKVSRREIPTPQPRFRAMIKRIRDINSRDFGKPCRTVRDSIADLPTLAPGKTCREYLNHFFNPGARSYAGHDGSPLDLPAKTLKAGDHGVPGGENTLRHADGSVRYFSIRECARLQTFPDDWYVEGSWTEGMRQLGNAVPVKLAQLVAEEVHRAIRRSSALSQC